MSDVVIIGAGPVGMYAAFYCGMRGLSSTVIDPMEVLGGRVSALYPEKKIYDVAGFSEIKAQQLIDNLEIQMNRFKDSTKILLGQKVVDVKKNDEEFKVITDKEVVAAKAVIIAAGSGAFSPRKLNLENEEIVNNIDYYVKDIKKYQNKKVTIFGGGDSALDWAMMLEKVAKEVNVVHRRDEFRAHENSVNKLKNSSINVYTPFTAQEIKVEQDQVKEIVIKNKAGETVKLKQDFIIVNYGFVAKLEGLDNWGLEIEGNKIKVDSMCKTNIKGVFAIGDIAQYDGKTDLITVGFGEAPIAVNSAFLKINPDSKLSHLHSSSIINE